MSNKFISILGVVVVAGGTSVATLKVLDHYTSKGKESIDQKISDYIDKNPEAIKTALETALQNEASATKEKQKSLIKKTSTELRNDPNSPIIGNENGSKEMILFIDPLCGYCRKFHPVILDIVNEIKDLKVIVKDYPIIGGETSLRIIQMGMAAKKQGKYNEFIDQIYAQEKLSLENLDSIAKKVKLDLTRLKKDMKSAEIMETIKSNMQLGRDLGVEGTPAFIYNNQLHSGYRDLEDLKKIITESVNG